MKTRISEWVKRYGPPEACALIGTLVGGTVCQWIFRNGVISAIGGTWGENVGYYGTIILRDLKHQRKLHGIVNKTLILKIIRNLVVEFGPSEYLDSFLIRPFLMYIFPKVTNNLMIGLILGKFTADIIFYIPTIISYELRKRFLID